MTLFTDPSDLFLRFGDLNPRRGLSGDIALYDAYSDKEEFLTEGGEALVEIEPAKYELRSIDFDHRCVLQSSIGSAER